MFEHLVVIRQATSAYIHPSGWDYALQDALVDGLKRVEMVCQGERWALLLEDDAPSVKELGRLQTFFSGHLNHNVWAVFVGGELHGLFRAYDTAAASLMVEKLRGSNETQILLLHVEQ